MYGDFYFHYFALDSHHFYQESHLGLLKNGPELLLYTIYTILDGWTASHTASRLVRGFLVIQWDQITSHLSHCFLIFTLYADENGKNSTVN